MNNLFGKKRIYGIMAAAGMAAVLSFAPANAMENAVLSGIQINPSEDSAYNIVLKTDKNISFEKQITSENKIVLDLKGVKPSQAVNTIYNNTANIDHVIFQPVSKDELRVFIQGKDIAQSRVNVDTKNLPLGLLDNLNSENTESSNNSTVLELNKPMDAYRPVVDMSEETADESESQNQQMLLGGFSLKNPFKTMGISWLISLAMMVFFALSASRLFKPAKKQINIDLSSSLKDRELDIYKKLNAGHGLLNAGLGNNKPPMQKPNLQYYSSYGIKEYQNSQVDPRLKANSFSKMRNEPKITPATANSILSSIPAASKTPALNRTAVSKKVGANDIKTAKTNIDGVKFLESMAKIYEKSGRVDLAHGLQNNIMKAKSVRQAI